MSISLRSIREVALIASLSCLAVYLVIHAIARRLEPSADFSEIALAELGTVVPSPTLRTFSGEVLQINDQSKATLYVLFSAGCPACARSASYWRALDEQLQDDNISIYLIALERDQEEVGRFANANGFDDLTVCYDAFGEVDNHLNIRYVPQYLLIDGAGKVLHVWAGALSPERDVHAEARETVEYLKTLLP